MSFAQQWNFSLTPASLVLAHSTRGPVQPMEAMTEGLLSHLVGGWEKEMRWNEAPAVGR